MLCKYKYPTALPCYTFPKSTDQPKMSPSCVFHQQILLTFHFTEVHLSLKLQCPSLTFFVLPSITPKTPSFSSARSPTTKWEKSQDQKAKNI